MPGSASDLTTVRAAALRCPPRQEMDLLPRRKRPLLRTIERCDMAMDSACCPGQAHQGRRNALTAGGVFLGRQALAPKKLAIWGANPYIDGTIGIGLAANG
jgi:hypothetical protein